MNEEWINQWNNRYREEEYAYGIAPNEFLKEEIDLLSPASILFGAEGEGRNAVYAATQGWKVSAFDISIEGKNKAVKLAEENGVSIDYHVGLFPDLPFADEEFDSIALIYAHFPPLIKSHYHQLLDKKLKKGGMIIFEAFGKNHLTYREQNPKVGGPTHLDALFSVDELKTDFQNYEILQLEEVEIELNEGVYHNGVGSVVRFVGRKK